MSDDELALRAAVIARPDDDTPRLVFADWLQDRGQDEYAEFIRCQVEAFNAGYPGGLTIRVARLHAAGGSKADHPAVDRAARLLSEFSTVWCQDMGTDAATAYEWNWVRGFVESVEVTAAAWLEHGDAITRLHPVRAVRLTTIPTMGYIEAGDFYRNRDEWGEQLLSRRWPGVTFVIPPDAVTLTARRWTTRVPVTPELLAESAAVWDFYAAAMDQSYREAFGPPSDDGRTD